MASDDINAYIGEIGRYQWRTLAIVCYLAMVITDAMQMVFIGGSMDHWCLVDELVGLPDDVQKDVAIPPGNGGGDGRPSYSSCEMYALNYSAYDGSDFHNWNRSVETSENTPVVGCRRWVYDRSRFQSTIVSKFNLVCGWSFLVPLVSTFYMAGMLVGSSATGLVSDRFGRKTAMLIFSVVKVAGSLTSIFANDYVTFLVGRVLFGISGIGIYLPGFVVVMELVGKRYRAWLSCILQAAYSVGLMIQPIVAYFLKDEFLFQIAVMSPSFVLPFVLIFWFPESPRWLLANRKRERLVLLVKEIIHVNGVSVTTPTDFDLTVTDDEVEVRQKRHTATCFALCSSSVIRLRAIIIYFSWFTCSLIYYALSLNTGSLHGNIYINTFVSGALEIPCYIVGTVLMDVKLFGRRLTGVLTFVGAGLASFLCIPMILAGYMTAATTFSMFGKAFICGSYAVVYLFASELFPTEIRNAGLGTGSTLARISSMSASFVGGPLMNVWRPLPSMLFGAVSTISGIAYFFLPETLGQPLADTVLQAEMSKCRQGVKQIRMWKCFRQQEDNESKPSHGVSLVEINDLKDKMAQDCQ